MDVGDWLDLVRLEGVWQLSRRIEDRQMGLSGRLDGTSVWRSDGEGLMQEERGVLVYGNAAPMEATRRYLWRQDGAGLAVFFEDGRPFHRIGPGRASDIHLCDPDTYDVRYDHIGNGSFSTVWRVTGPRKDLVLMSRYSPS